MYVFPGGKAQDSDRDVDAWVGPSAEEWGKRFGCDADTARGLVVAAVRETFEESGILLAGPDADTVVADTSAPDMQAARVALENGEYGFAEFLAERGLVLRADLLGAWSHWITPAFEPRRYDTRFFVAALPEGQVVGELPARPTAPSGRRWRRVLECGRRREGDDASADRDHLSRGLAVRRGRHPRGVGRARGHHRSRPSSSTSTASCSSSTSLEEIVSDDVATEVTERASTWSAPTTPVS